MPLPRLFLLIFAVASVFFVCLYFFFLERRRERLARGWMGAPRAGDRDPWTEEDLSTYKRRLRLRLALILYGGPVLVMVALFWLQERM
ncbi:MAG: hypothetical protein ACU0CO_02345 [Shimia sp.]